MQRKGRDHWTTQQRVSAAEQAYERGQRDIRRKKQGKSTLQFQRRVDSRHKDLRKQACSQGPSHLNAWVWHLRAKEETQREVVNALRGP